MTPLTNTEQGELKLPPVVSPEEWEAERLKLLAKEKKLMRERDALAAERRRLPRVRIEKDYVFTGPEGEAHLPDLFDGRRQLLLYHFMFAPGDHACDGCSMFVDQIGHLAHLHARDTSMVLVSRATIEELEAFRRRMGWTIPWYSSFGSDFNYDFGVSRGEGAETDGNESFGLSVFLRDGDEIYRTYFRDRRGVEELGTVWSLLDLTPLGRQETWEDSPEGYPQSEPYGWWRYHDSYEEAETAR